MLSKIKHKIFISFFARRAALFMHRRFPELGLEADKIMLLASSGSRAGIVTLSGLTIPKFEYDVWLGDMWKHYTAVLDGDEVALLIPDSMLINAFDVEHVSFNDERISPIVEILKTVALGYFPFHNTAAFPRSELQARLPRWVG